MLVVFGGWLRLDWPLLSTTTTHAHAQGEEKIAVDEQYATMDVRKLPSLKPAFKRDGGVVTAGNASSLNDGAAALVVMSAGKAKAGGHEPLARILGELRRPPEG